MGRGEMAVVRLRVTAAKGWKVDVHMETPDLPEASLPTELRGFQKTA